MRCTVLTIVPFTALLLAPLACTAKAPSPKALSSSNHGSSEGPPPAIVLRNVDFVSSRGSAVFAQGHMSRVAYEQTTGKTNSENLELRFPRQGRPNGAVDVSAPLAEGNPFDEQVIGEGGVRFRNAQGDHGTTEVAHYDGKLGEADGDRTVFLWGPGFTLGSPGFRWRAADDSLDLGPTTVRTRGKGP